MSSAEMVPSMDVDAIEPLPIHQPQPQERQDHSRVHGTITPPAPQTRFTPISQSSDASDNSFRSSILQEEAKLPWNSEEQLHKVSRQMLKFQKYVLIFVLVAINAVLIWAAWTYSQYYYIFLVLLGSNTMLQGIMIVCLAFHWLWTHTLRLFWTPKENVPETPERICMLLPCYSETREEIERSLESLARQQEMDGHARMILIVVDGDVKSRGMEKTTQRHLIEDILVGEHRTYFQNGYRARDGLFMPITVQSGYYSGIPYIMIGKKYNQGKRDSLTFARSFLYHFKQRSVALRTIFNPEVFDYLGNYFIAHGLDQVDYLVGMDADTVFADDCILEMVKEIRKDPKVVGVCGHVCVDYDGKNFSFWGLYQSVEYSLTQGLRRMFQSRITGKVNCLPGCCQLIRVDEATFGDEVLREKFGYVPKPNDTMTHHIMGNYSEDSIHASVIFSVHPHSRTAQALKAKAYTVVPDNWSVFLSQRKRWSLGSISNEFVMIFRPGIIFVERLQSIITAMTWAIMPFIIAAVIGLVIHLVRNGSAIWKDKIFVGLFCILFLRYFYSFCMVIWLPRNLLERVQFVVGFAMHMVTSPFMNIIIIIYSLAHSDEFKWGKTRDVVEDDASEGLLEGQEKRPVMM
ncbi:hypothetical protein IFR05_013998 [Cadophora sp. M221]|nr:hypothetical protein IFR05_013998 [Cadophora sp. M221]